MNKKYHFSPVSQKWVTCQAVKRVCAYGGSAHKTEVEVKALLLDNELKHKNSVRGLPTGSLLELYRSGNKKEVSYLTVQEAESKFVLAKTYFDSKAKEIRSEYKHVPVDFAEQLKALEDASVIHSLTFFDSVPDSDAVKKYAAQVSEPRKHELGLCYMEVKAAEENLRTVLYKSLKVSEPSR